MNGVVDQVHAGGLQRLACQIPICRLADLPDAQAGGRSHARRTDVATDGDQCGECVSSLYSRWQTSAAAVKEMMEEVGLIIDVDQCVDELNLRHPRLQQILQAVGGILFRTGLETRK